MITLAGISTLPDLGLRPAQGAGAAAATSGAGQDFSSLLGRLAGNSIDAVRGGEAAALAGIQGSMPLQSVVEKVMAAERTLQASLAVRDKVVSAYQEISRMQI